jgi:hypothetical protein
MACAEFTGFESTTPSSWMPKDSERLWRGSYKGKDWRYIGDGAWEPKVKSAKGRRQPQAAGAAAAAAAATAADASGDDDGNSGQEVPLLCLSVCLSPCGPRSPPSPPCNAPFCLSVWLAVSMWASQSSSPS